MFVFSGICGFFWFSLATVHLSLIIFMERNTIFAVILSTLFLIFWWTYFQPQPQKPVYKNSGPVVSAESTSQAVKPVSQASAKTANIVSGNIVSGQPVVEKEIVFEGKYFTAVFSSLGAGIKSWQVKEKNTTVDLVISKTSGHFSTFDDLNYSAVKNGNKIIFSAVSNHGYTITKTYELNDSFLNDLTINIKPSKTAAAETVPVLSWGPGLGTDAKEKEENTKLTRVIGLSTVKEGVLETLKTQTYSASDYKWIAIDNRYFLSAVIPEKSLDFDSITVAKEDKKLPPSFALSKKVSGEQTINLKFYIGPKKYGYLKSFKLGLGQSVDFGWFGFLGKAALETLNFFHKITNNYGWAIIILTLCIQVLVFPLTIKSFKAQADMKRLQPLIKDLQTKYKNDPKRLNMEMLNIYKTHKVNPLGGCLPMILQLPIFWALFTTLRNAYELRGAEWMFWIKDLSSYDPYYVLPIIMGLGMLIQQKMVSVSIDPAQAKMMLLMPVIFTFMFLKFPSGLVIYWITNSVVTMVEQYFFLTKNDNNTVNIIEKT